MSRPKKGEPGYEEANAKHRQTMIKKYGEDGYRRKMQEIGRKGGKACGMKGFALDKNRARKAGTAGGAKSIRGYKLIKEDEYTRLYKNSKTGATVKYIYNVEVGKFVKDEQVAIMEEIKNENWI